MRKHRIMIIGCGGTGKSTLARKLHQILGIKLVHLDHEFWNPNWVEPDKEEWRQTVQEVASEDSWIIDGNYGGTMDIRMERADTVIFLDRSRFVCLYRVVKRFIVNFNKTRPDMAEGCNEHLDIKFLKYIWDYNRTRRPTILTKLKALESSKTVHILSSDSDIVGFIKSIRQSMS